MTDLFYTLGTVAGGLLRGEPGDVEPSGDQEDGPEDDLREDNDLLVNAVLGSAAAWVIKKALRPKSVSWPRVVVAGIGASVLAEVLGAALGSGGLETDEEDDDALLLRIGSGVALAAGYASIVYPRVPGSPRTKGLVFSAMELAATPFGGLVQVASDTPGLKFPLKDLALPVDGEASPAAKIAFGVGLGLLYRPDLADDD